jgi:hypothetical protein
MAALGLAQALLLKVKPTDRIQAIAFVNARLEIGDAKRILERLAARPSRRSRAEIAADRGMTGLEQTLPL